MREGRTIVPSRLVKNTVRTMDLRARTTVSPPQPTRRAQLEVHAPKERPQPYPREHLRLRVPPPRAKDTGDACSPHTAVVKRYRVPVHPQLDHHPPRRGGVGALRADAVLQAAVPRAPLHGLARAPRHRLRLRVRLQAHRRESPCAPVCARGTLTDRRAARASLSAFCRTRATATVRSPSSASSSSSSASGQPPNTAAIFHGEPLRSLCNLAHTDVVKADRARWSLRPAGDRYVRAQVRCWFLDL